MWRGNESPQATNRRLILGGFCFFGSFLMPGRERAMHGTNLQLIVLRCCVCRRLVALSVDPDDVLAFNEGMYIQDACPYLPPELR